LQVSPPDPKFATDDVVTIVTIGDRVLADLRIGTRRAGWRRNL